MNREDRAKQFMVFDALKGLQEALREKEIEYIEKIELSEESQDELSNTLNQISKGDNILVNYYKNRQYKQLTGIVKEISSIKKKIIINNDIEIVITDILEIKKI